MTCDSHAASDTADPRVSVIVNVRNGSATLREALDSVLAQTFRDWEVIIWDDCSVDDSAQVAAEYSSERVRYFLSEETSLGRARELAIREARGEWLAFLDQDDIWLPDKLEKQMALVEDAPHVGLVYGRTVMFSPWGRERDFDHRHEFQPLPEGDIFERLFIDSCFICMSAAVLRRSAVEEVGGIPDVVQVIPDYYLFLAVARRYAARAVQDVVCRYRLHAGSMSLFSGARMHEEALLLIDAWAHSLDASLADRRRTIHSTVLAFEELRRLDTAGRGLLRLLTAGSTWFLLSRPFARAYRAVRRRVRRPYWKRHDRMRTARAEPSDGLVLSVIVVNWNVRELLEDCLRSLYEEVRLPRDAWEVLVVDNASGDGSVDMVRTRFPQAILLANDQNLGFGRANNQAFRLSRGRYVLLLNPDTVVLDQAIDRMLAIMRARGDLGALGCRMVDGARHLQRWTGGSLPSMANIACHFLFLYKVLPVRLLPKPLYLEAEPAEDVEVGWVSGACLLARREALGERIFDERFFLYGEDLELCDRLARAGWKVAYTPNAQIVHYDGRSLQHQSPDVHLNKLRNLRAVFAARNPAWLLFFYDLAVSAGFLMRALLFGIASHSRPGQGYDGRAARSRLWLNEAVRTLMQR